jgi:GxxExxY protein
MKDINEVTGLVIGAAIRVHRELGPGLLESAYEACLAFEIAHSGLRVERQMAVPLTYRGLHLDCGYRIDLFVERTVVLEVKAVQRLERIHEAQVLSYLKLSGCHAGLLINFNVVVLKDGIKRIVHNFAEPNTAISAPSAPSAVQTPPSM